MRSIALRTMKLIGMLDSPYVRRVAISFQLLKIRFDHHSISVFRGYDEFRQINPVVKAPSLICDDGQVLMDSTLIIEFGESIAGQGRSLMPSAPQERQRVLRLTGLALAACEKSVSIYYERTLRPAEKLHQPWMDRITAQLLAAYRLLEEELGARPLAATSAGMNQAGLSVAIAWQFTQQVLPGVMDPTDFPALREFSAVAERLPEFRAAPHGAGTYRLAE
jgi:glutathione S-transferase